MEAFVRRVCLAVAAVLFVIAGFVSATSSSWTHLVAFGFALVAAGLAVD
jgi:hypothetical protein